MTAAATMSTPVIAIHGGAGTINAGSLDAAAAARYHQALREVVGAAQALLLGGASAVDAVCLAVALLEDCPLFNAGHGAVFTADATHELDAAVMRGADLAAGAVAGVSRLRNPVHAARAVMDEGRHVLMVGRASRPSRSGAAWRRSHPAISRRTFVGSNCTRRVRPAAWCSITTARRWPRGASSAPSGPWRSMGRVISPRPRRPAA